MPPSPPFYDPVAESLDTDQLLAEAVPLAKLVVAVGVVVLVPLLLRFALVDVTALDSALGVVLTVATQFLAAVGTGIVLMYVVARAVQLAG